MRIWRLTGENGISLLVALIPVPLVNFGFRNVQSTSKRFNLLLSPVRVFLKLYLENFALKSVHSGHKPLAVGLKSVAL